jgi:hypothetical protein
MLYQDNLAGIGEGKIKNFLKKFEIFLDIIDLIGNNMDNSVK